MARKSVRPMYRVPLSKRPQALDNLLRWLRVPGLPTKARLRLLPTDSEGGIVTVKFLKWFTDRRWFYMLYSWYGIWTWGFGVDREGFGLYVGPFSGWLVWRGR
jgi:hypothetical protein